MTSRQLGSNSSVCLKGAKLASASKPAACAELALSFADAPALDAGRQGAGRCAPERRAAEAGQCVEPGRAGRHPGAVTAREYASCPEPDRAGGWRTRDGTSRRESTLYRVFARRRSAASARRSQPPQRRAPRPRTLRRRQPGMVVGHHLLAVAGADPVLLPVPDRRRLQPQSGRLGGLRAGGVARGRPRCCNGPC